MISPNDIINKYVPALAASAEIEAWCQTNFSKSPKIFVGIDNQNPPAASDAPFLAFRVGPSAEGDEVTGFQYTMTVDWIIVDKTQTTVGKVTSLNGPKKSDELGRLIMDCLRNASLNVVLSSWTYYIESVEFFPMIAANMEITLNVPHIIGGAITL